MSEPDSPEDAVRRALAEVAASTPNADVPPPLGDPVVALVDRRRWQRQVLIAVAAVIAIVAGITGAALLTGGDDEPESVETADDASTTTTTADGPTTSTSSTTVGTSTTSTTSATATTATTVGTGTSVPTTARPRLPSGERLAAGDGWEVRLVDGCVVILGDGVEIGRECDRDQAAWLLAAPLAGGGAVYVAGGREVVTADAFTSGGTLDDVLQIVSDSGTGHYVVTDASPSVVLLRQGAGSDWVAGVYGGQLVTEGPAFADHSAYQRATGSLSFGRLQEVGGHIAGGNRCVLARQVTPTPAVVADFCWQPQDRVTAVLVPTEDPELFDLFGFAVDVGAWRCDLPDGGSCGTGEIAGIAGFGGIIANHGPISVGDATEVVIAVDGGSVVVPVPPPA